ncbi:crossover junction endodeoxyribonuclease RuvC [Candidatus Saccharibacteria bacterium]|jgi:crossover junction endodeoxyribonuclease RuvC|nr:crossover junction endodeoxyribonuclease RuvC [Candidatus Saccharibacteria bacterium]
MRILGIDPGTGITGFGVIDIKRGKPSMVVGGVIRTKPQTPLPERLKIIHSDLVGLIREFEPEVMSVEKLFFAQNVTTAIAVSHARGVVLLAGEVAGLEIFEYTPLQIKQSVTGYGKATKAQVQEMVRVLLELKVKPTPDDAADALAAALCHSHQQAA